MTQDRPGWWSRNWKWAAPSGCLVLVLLLFGGCAAMVAGVFGIMRNTEPYAHAVARVQTDEEATAALGSPIATGWWLAGSYHDSIGTGTADYTIPVSGPRGTGTLYVEARKRAGRWSFVVLSLDLDNGDTIDLRTDDEIADAEGAPPTGVDPPDLSDPSRDATEDGLRDVDSGTASDDAPAPDEAQIDHGDGTKPLRYGTGRRSGEAPRDELPDARERDLDPGSSSA